MIIKTYIKSDFTYRASTQFKRDITKLTRVTALYYYKDSRTATGYRILIILPDNKIINICAGLLEYSLSNLLYHLKPYHLIKPIKYLL